LLRAVLHAMSLKHKTFSSVRWTTVAAVVRAALQVGQIAILTRLLNASEYGLMAMVGVVLSFALLFADLGVNSAYVQRPVVSQRERSSLFWLNLGIAGSLTLLVMMVSPLLAWMFGDHRLAPLLALSATTCILIAIGQQVRLTAEKNLEFRAVVLVEIGSALLGFGASIVAAVAGLGVYALVLGNIVAAAAASVMAWTWLSDGWLPSRNFSLADVRPYVGFGGAAMASSIVNQLNASVDLLLGGRLLGAQQLGLFSVPRSLILQIQFMINPIITRVGFPLIAQVQADRSRVRSIYLQTLGMTSSTNAPIYMALAFFAPEVAQLLLGRHWAGSIDFLRILALWGFVRSTLGPVGSLLLGTGRADLALKWNMGLLCVVPPILWVGSHFGPAGLSWALLAFTCVAFVPTWLLLVRPLCDASLAEYSVAALKPMLIAAAAIGIAFVVAGGTSNTYLRLLALIAIGAPLYWLLSLRGNPGWTAAMLTLVRGARARAS
jgi:O-antigen/teichoic acid export membrane protein